MRKKIFFDVDNTICNSTKRFVEIYNSIYNDQADWTKCFKWDYSDVCPKLTDSEIIFSLKQFYNDEMDFVDKYIEVVIKMLHITGWDVNFVTLGTRENLINKTNWLKHNFPYIDKQNYHLLEKTEMGKSEVDMSNAILVDDNCINLLSSNAEFKICMHKPTEWNKDIESLRYTRVNNALELYNYILNLEREGVIIG